MGLMGAMFKKFYNDIAIGGDYVIVNISVPTRTDLSMLVGMNYILLNDIPVFDPMSDLVYHVQINDQLIPYERKSEILGNFVNRGDQVKLIVENRNGITPGKYKVKIGNHTGNAQAKFKLDVHATDAYV